MTILSEIRVAIIECSQPKVIKQKRMQITKWCKFASGIKANETAQLKSGVT
jgi:hypothetical protein